MRSLHDTSSPLGTDGASSPEGEEFPPGSLCVAPNCSVSGIDLELEGTNGGVKASPWTFDDASSGSLGDNPTDRCRNSLKAKECLILDLYEKSLSSVSHLFAIQA